MKQNKILSLISLAAKAGRIVSGEFATEKAVKDGTAAMAVIAGDASENTKKKFRNMCDFYKVQICIYADNDTVVNEICKYLLASVELSDGGFA